MSRRQRWCIFCRDAAPMRGGNVCARCLSRKEWDAKLLLYGWAALWAGVIACRTLVGR